MGREKNTRYLEKALSGILDGFDGKLLEVPVGTGVLTIPVYRTLPQADIVDMARFHELLEQPPDLLRQRRPAPNAQEAALS